MATCNMRRQIEKIGYLRRDVAFGLIFAHKPSSTHTHFKLIYSIFPICQFLYL